MKLFDKLKIVILGLLVLAAIISRLIAFQELSHSSLYHEPILDSQYYNNRAMAIASSGDWIGNRVFFMSPLYPYFLAIIYFLGGDNIDLVRIIQHFLGILSLILFYQVLKQLFAPGTRLLAMAMLVGYPLFVFLESQLLLASLLTFLVISLLFFQIRNEKQQGSRGSLVTGIIIGLLSAGRGTFIVFLPVILIFIYMRYNPEKRLNCIITAFLGFALVIGPICLRNYLVSKQFVLLTTNSGLNFYIGNNAHAEGGYVMLDYIDPDKDPSGRLYAESMLKSSLNDKEVSRFWRDLAIQEIRTNPGHYLVLYFRKLLLFFSGYEIPQLENFFYYRENIMPVLKYLRVNFSVISPLAALGMILGLRYRKDLLILSLLILSQAFAISLFFISGRYRVPLVPLFIIFAAYAFDQLFHFFKLKKLLAGLVSLVVLFGLFIGLNLKYPATLDFSVMEYNLGVIMKNKADYKAALQHFARINPKSAVYAESLYASGICYQQSGLPEHAINAYVEAEKLLPARAEIPYNMGTIYDSLQQYDKALSAYHQSIKLNPNYAKSYNNLGMLLMKIGNFKDAASVFRKAIELDKWYLIAYMNLGRCYYMQRDLDSALLVFQEAINRFPDRYEGYQNYGIILLEMGLTGKAKDMIEQAYQKNPADPRTLELLKMIQDQASGTPAPANS